MNKGQHNTFKKLSPDFFSIECMPSSFDVFVKIKLNGGKPLGMMKHEGTFF